MDNDRFHQSQDFRHVDRNLQHNPALKAESYRQQVTDYINDMRSKNQEASREGFFKQVQDSAPENWDEIQQHLNEAWENRQEKSDEG